MLSKFMTAKVGAAAIAVALAGGGAAAAATGSLPGPAQRAVSRALSHVDISVPSPDGHANTHAAGGAANANGHAKGPDAAASAKYGLCTASGAGPSTTNPHAAAPGAVAFSNLQQAADAAGMSVADYCKDVTPPRADGDAGAPSSVPAPPSTGSPNANAPSTTLPSQAGSAPTSVPPVTTPVTTPVTVGPPASIPPGPPTTPAHGRP
jgi:hypothetical protein